MSCPLCDGRGAEARFGRASMRVGRAGAEPRLVVDCGDGRVVLMPVAFCPVCGRRLVWEEPRSAAEAREGICNG